MVLRTHGRVLCWAQRPRWLSAIPGLYAPIVSTRNAVFEVGSAAQGILRQRRSMMIRIRSGELHARVAAVACVPLERLYVGAGMCQIESDARGGKLIALAIRVTANPRGGGGATNQDLVVEVQVPAAEDDLGRAITACLDFSERRPL